MREISTLRKRSDEALVIALPGIVDLSYLIFPSILQQISIQILHIIEKALIPQVVVVSSVVKPSAPLCHKLFSQ